MSVEKVGDLLIERKLISPEHLQEALEWLTGAAYTRRFAPLAIGSHASDS